MNALVGERISIATFKAQTTRHRIMGIYNTDEMQIVFSDTPGVLKPNYKLQESMLNFSTSALTDADILLYVTDVVETPDKNNEFMEKVRQMTAPVLLLINKIDLTDQEKLVKLVEEWKELLPQAEIIPISAASKFNVDYVMKRIKELLPDSPPYFGKDQWTDKPARFFVNEIIREKILSRTTSVKICTWANRWCARSAASSAPTQAPVHLVWHSLTKGWCWNKRPPKKDHPSKVEQPAGCPAYFLQRETGANSLSQNLTVLPAPSEREPLARPALTALRPR